MRAIWPLNNSSRWHIDIGENVSTTTTKLDCYLSEVNASESINFQITYSTFFFFTDDDNNFSTFAYEQTTSNTSIDTQWSTDLRRKIEKLWIHLMAKVFHLILMLRAVIINNCSWLNEKLSPTPRSSLNVSKTIVIYFDKLAMKNFHS